MQKRNVDAVVISDVHLGTYGCHAKELVAYLRSIAPQILILNGDIIDAWQFNKRFFPSSHLAVLKEIIGMLGAGSRVIYITGNHDEMLRRYSDLQLGSFELKDKLVIEIDNKMTWIFHGDVFDNTTKGAAKFWAKLGSSGYALLLATNRLVNRILKLLGRERISLSKRIMKEVNRRIIKVEKFESLVAELAIEKKYHHVICGHIHQPGKKSYSNMHGSVQYLNSGDWVEHLTALEYYNNDWHIYRYEDSELKAADIRETGTETRVITDEINLFIHSLGA
jgi:UDP-2,3-diacylglucosamine pyrophosphatase LpxH